MKKVIAILLIAVLALGLLAACGSKKKDPSELLIGKWERIDEENDFTHTWEFKEDGTINIVQKGYMEFTGHGEYEVNGDQLTISDGGGTWPFQVDEDTLTVSFPDGDWVFTRK